MIATFIIAAVLAAEPSAVRAEIKAAEQLEHAVVHHVAGVVPLGGQDVLDMRVEAARMLKSKLPPVRRAGCLFLKHFGTSEHLPALRKLVRDPIDRVAAEAVLAVASLRDVPSIRLLVVAFKRDGPLTKEAVVIGLATLHSETGASQAKVALQGLLEWTKNPNDRLRIGRTLADIGE